MKAVILAGGRGSRISEETSIKPKPMIEIGEKPILWHIMKFYSAHGINDFVICCGYLGYVIKEYFANYFVHTSDVTYDLANNKVEVHHQTTEPWKVTLVDTGLDSMTGGRLKRVKQYLDDEDFCFTYGDGLSDVNITKLLKFHQESGKLATVTAVQPPGRFGALILDSTDVKGFREKPEDGGWINGGFFILNPQVIDYIEDDSTTWEREPMERLVKDNQMNAFLHHGFFQPMDTLRDKNQLEEMWEKGKAPWKIWK
jgi:glucose-1-phosphate cytidylyltransferase